MDNTPKNFEQMYKVNQPLIYRFMFWRTKDQMLAQDLTSHVFEKAWRTRQSFKGGSSKAWLYRIARTTLIDYWRKRKDVLDDGTIISKALSEDAALEEVVDRNIALEVMHEALLQLPGEMYEVVRLRFIEGRSARETAAELGISEGNVRVIQYRALKKLRSFMS
jgi:RNA polymerase sigma-70 factor, ECF subfamily